VNDLFYYGENGVIKKIDKCKIQEKKEALISELKRDRR